MGKSKTRKTPDYYAQRAKKEGYPARSVYKLDEIQQKFHLIQPGMHVLDIGAAPGSWTLYLQRTVMKKGGTITAVDLKDLTLSPLPPSVTFLKGDAFSPENRNRIADTDADAEEMQREIETIIGMMQDAGVIQEADGHAHRLFDDVISEVRMLYPDGAAKEELLALFDRLQQ